MADMFGNKPPPAVRIQNDIRVAPKIIAQVTSLQDGGAIAPNPTAMPVLPSMQRVYDIATFVQYPFTGSFYLPADANRKYLLVQNQGSGVLYVDFSGASGANTIGLQIVAGGYYEPLIVPYNGVNFSAASGLVIVGST